MPEGTTLVLGGGGVAGIAWMTGLLAGLADAGQDVTGTDSIIGTSAGATVAAQVGSGLPLDELFACQADPGRQVAEIAAEVDLQQLGTEFAGLFTGPAATEREALARIGAFALAAQTVPRPPGGRSSSRGCPRRTGPRGRSCWSPSTRSPARCACSTGSPGSA